MFLDPVVTELDFLVAKMLLWSVVLMVAECLVPVVVLTVVVVVVVVDVVVAILEPDVGLVSIPEIVLTFPVDVGPIVPVGWILACR